jgi:rhodanese-related sulfurtransferase
MDTQSLVVLVVAALAFVAFWWLKRPDISSSRARLLVGEGARLVDVRSPAEFAAAHLEGARNIPVGEIGRRARELGGSAKPIVLYCASGTRSALAKRTLKSAGFTQVYNLGSIHNW